MSLPYISTLVILPNLAPGGAQKQGLILAKQLAESGIPPAIFLTHSTETTNSNRELSAGIPIFFAGDVVKKIPFLERIDRILLAAAQRTGPGWGIQLLKRRLSNRIFRGLGVPHEISRNLETNLKIGVASRAIRLTIERQAPKLLISFLPQTNIATLLGANGKQFVVVVERNDFVRQNVGSGIRRAQSLTYPMSNLIAANSKNAVGQMMKYFPDNRVVFVPNTYPAPIRPNLWEGRPQTILVVGRLEPQKRPIEVLKAFLDSGIGSEGWKLVFVGSGSLERSLREVAGGSPEKNHIEFLGHVTSGEIPYEKASFAILNSDYEGSPNVLAEAIASGVVPLVRDSITEAKEFISDKDQQMLIFSDQAQLSGIFQNLGPLTNAHSATIDALTNTYKRRLKEYARARQAFLGELVRIASVPMKG